MPSDDTSPMPRALAIEALAAAAILLALPYGDADRAKDVLTVVRANIEAVAQCFCAPQSPPADTPAPVAILH